MIHPSLLISYKKYHKSMPESNAKNIIGDLLEEREQLFEEGDAEALKRILFDFRYLGSKAGFANMFIEHHSAILCKLIDAAEALEGKG